MTVDAPESPPGDGGVTVGRSATMWVALGTGVLAALVSVGRILLENGSALSTLVWAEDGLFPLCVRTHGLLDCTRDPFAGYFLLLPRLIAWPISALPLDAWPWATNLAAATFAGCAAGLVVLILRSAGSGLVVSGLLGLLPVLVPISGFEAINASGSGYMLLAYVGALAICFPPRGGRFPTVAYVVGALVIALTIPSSVVLLLPLAVQLIRRRVPLRPGLLAGGALVAGLAVQLLVMLTAAAPRRIDISTDTLRSWADGVPNALLTLLPGQASLNEDGTLDSSIHLGSAGVLIVVAILLGGVALLFVRSRTASNVGLLLLVGLAVGAIPALSGYANNRYFVVPIVIWAAAGLLALDHLLPRRRELVMGLAAVVLVAMWVPGLPASHFRATAAPPWPQIMGEVRTSCTTDPNATVLVIFTPAWPFADAQWLGPTTNVVTCASLRP